MTTRNGSRPNPVFFGENVTGGTVLDDMKSRYSSFFLRRTFDAPAPGTRSPR
ncbi:MAG: hypothetical protein CM1200mP29_15740 [Verrucomicrobiota bacterium]|nr:MAG: hypothetical protein CM1200mP29_15740 [Verrucomicrobiota bacterium]